MSTARAAATGLGFAPEPFLPPLWLRGSHQQTIGGEVLWRGLPGEAALQRRWLAAERQELFEMPDGDRLLGHLHLHPDDPDRDRPIVIHLHGLEARAESNVQRALSCKAFACNLHSLRLNFRNCGQTEHLSRDFYYGSKTGDIASVIEQLASRWGFKRIYLTGVSLGGNLLLRLLADAGETAPPLLAGACAISPPIELDQALTALSRGFNRIYDQYFVKSLKTKLRRKVRLSPDGTRLASYLGHLSRIRSLAQWDREVTVPLGGFADTSAYYALGSSGPLLGRIQVPTLIIHAKDDPFLPHSMYEPHAAAIAGNPHLTTLFPDHGGHVGFRARTPGPEPWMDRYWAENQAIAFLASLP